MRRPGESAQGQAFAVAASVLWGFTPLYFPLLKPAGAIEILAYRIIFSLVFLVAVLALTRGLGGVRQILRTPRKFGWLAAGSLALSVNWAVYITAVNGGHVLEASLGLFMIPLVMIVFGVIVLRERLRPGQWAAVLVGLAAIVVIAADVGAFPWIALTLSCTFSWYGLCKKQAAAGAVESLVVETSVLALPAVVAMVATGALSDLATGSRSPANVTLLVLSGPVTAIPMALFAAGALRLPLSVTGLLQYITPVLVFAVGVWIRHEPLPTSELIGFCLVWVALAGLTADGLRGRPARRARERADPAVEAAEPLEQGAID